MQANHDLSRVCPTFDEAILVPNAGLLPAAVLAQRIGLGGLVDRRLHLARHGTDSGAKALTVIGSMLVGGDSIDDTAVLRAGAAGKLFDGTRAPSTIGSWLRAHRWSNVRQLDAVSRQLLARLWSCGAGPADLSSPLTIDLDSTIVAVHGRAKQGAAFGYTKVRGYHPQLATCAQTGQLLMSRLRGGAAGAARGAKSFLTETVSRVRHAGATGQLTVRADSAFYSKAVIAPPRSSTSGSPSPPGRTSGSVQPSTRSRRRPGSRSRTGSPHRRSPAPTSPRRPSPSSPATSATPDRSASSCAGSGRPPAASWRCSPPGTTTPSSPTGTCRWPRPRPTTADTQSSSRASPSSKAPAWPSCPRLSGVAQPLSMTCAT